MAAVGSLRRMLMLLWVSRRLLPPQAALRLRRTAIGVALVLLAFALFGLAAASLLATPIVALLGEAWEIPLAVAGGLMGGGLLAAVGARRSVVRH